MCTLIVMPYRPGFRCRQGTKLLFYDYDYGIFIACIDVNKCTERHAASTTSGKVVVQC